MAPLFCSNGDNIISPTTTETLELLQHLMIFFKNQTVAGGSMLTTEHSIR